MKQKLIFLFAILSMSTLFACSSAPVEIEKVTSENSELHSSMMDEVKHEIPTVDQFISHVELQEDLNDGPDIVEIGEKFPVNNYCEEMDLGEIYATITGVRAYNNLSSAGIAFEDTFDMLDGLQYNVQTDEFINGRFFVTVDFEVENVNAVSDNWHYEPDKYDEYDFRVDSIGGCGSVMHWNGITGTLKNENCGEHPFVFHLEPGESVSFSVSYLIYLHGDDIEDVWFNTAGTPALGYAIDLHLKDIVPEEWLVFESE